MRKKDFHEIDLRNFFKRDKDSLNLAKMCLMYLEHSAVSLSDEELKANIIEKKLREEGYEIEGSDYREREKEVGDLFSSVLDSLVRLNMIIRDEGSTLLNFNHNYIPQHDYYG